MPSDFKTYYKFNVILLMEKKSLKTDSLNTWLIVTEVKRCINGEKQCSSTNGAGATVTSVYKKKLTPKTKPYLVPYAEINSKWW